MTIIHSSALTKRGVRPTSGVQTLEYTCRPPRSDSANTAAASATRRESAAPVGGCAVSVSADFKHRALHSNSEASQRTLTSVGMVHTRQTWPLQSALTFAAKVAKTLDCVKKLRRLLERQLCKAPACRVSDQCTYCNTHTTVLLGSRAQLYCARQCSNTGAAHLLMRSGKAVHRHKQRPPRDVLQHRHRVSWHKSDAART